MPMPDAITDEDEAIALDDDRYRVRVRHALFRWHDTDGSMRHARGRTIVDLPEDEFRRGLAVGAFASPHAAEPSTPASSEFSRRELVEVIVESDVDGVIDFAVANPDTAELLLDLEQSERSRPRKGVMGGLASVIEDRDHGAGDGTTDDADVGGWECDHCDFVGDEDTILDHYAEAHPDEELPAAPSDE